MSDTELEAREEAGYAELESHLRAQIESEIRAEATNRVADLEYDWIPGIQVFICYASEDRESALEIYHRLETEGFKPWVDKENLLPGQDWNREIRKAIRASDFAVVCFSHQSTSKPGYYQRELKLLLEVLDEMPEGQIFVIPVKIDDCETPERFKHIQSVDLYDQGGLDRVVESIRAHAATFFQYDRVPEFVEMDLWASGPKEKVDAFVKDLEDLGFFTLGYNVNEGVFHYIGMIIIQEYDEKKIGETISSHGFVRIKGRSSRKLFPLPPPKLLRRFWTTPYR